MENPQIKLPQYSKLPPQAPDLEEAVLSAVLIEKTAIDKIVGMISEKTFYVPRHQLIFRAMAYLQKHQLPIDLLTVMQQMKKTNDLDQAGGAAYLAQLTSKVTSSANIEYHAVLLVEKYMLRRVIEAGSRMVDEAYKAKADGPEIMNDAHQYIMELMLGMSRRTVSTALEIGVERTKHYEAVRNRADGTVNGVPAGLNGIDDWIGGFKPGKLYTIAARPAMGKTALIMSMVLNQAVRRGIPVGIFSLEMPKEELYDRLVSQEAHVHGSKIQDTKLCSPEEYGRVLNSQEHVDVAPIQIDDTEGINIMELRSKARDMVKKGAQIIYIDYVQLAKADTGRNSTRSEEVGLITRSMKGMAKELQVPVVELAQLSRAVEATADKRPMLSHLKESGSIEEDSDVVMFVYRPEYYGIKGKSGEPLRGHAEIIIGKNRGGPTGTGQLVFIDYLAKFRSYEETEDADWIEVEETHSLPPKLLD